MASNPFLFFPMEPGSSSSASAAGSNPGQPPLLRPNPVLYVPPLRIVAPPGVPPILPPSFDPHSVLNGLRPDLFPQAASSSYGGSLKVPSRSDFDRVRTATVLGDLGRPASAASGVRDYERTNFGNGNHAPFWNGKGHRFGNADQARGGIGINAPAPSSNNVRYFSSFKGGDRTPEDLDARPSASHSGTFNTAATENGAVPNDGNSSYHAAAAKFSKTKASAVRLFPLGCFKNEVQSQAEVSKILSSHENFADEGSALETKKRCREFKPKRSIASKRPATDGSGLHTSPHRAVIYTVRLYDALRRSLMHEEERKSKDANKGSRPDLNAGSVINSKSLAVNRSQKLVGSVPGIDVGALFYFRMELCCVGLHGPIQAGIEYITAKESEHDTAVAISIISSGGYDAKDDGEELVYTGQGGKSALVSKPMEDQKLERGNLAMKGSMKHQVPVRVTRGVKDSASPSGKTYTYDGLYLVEECWTEKGKSGFEEFKFRLRRCPGQAELGSAILKLSNSLKYRPGQREGLRLPDIANGKEGVPVCVVNSVDNLHSPPNFEYSTSLHYPPEASIYHHFGSAEGCNCEGVCSPQACSCCAANGGVFPYLGGGILVKERGVIFECGSNCKCSFSCKNRLTQRALKYRLEIFKSKNKGWGLRSWDTIPAGSFICEYSGKLVQTPQFLQTRDFVLDFRRLPRNNPFWGDVSSFLDSQAAQVTSSIPRPELIIDSSQTGNAARFINHSCSPNVLVQCVFRDYQDTKRPHVMLFAMDNIPPFRELTIDYGSEPPSPHYQVPGKQCLCKSEECKGTFYQ
ncbi:hypothetical protein GOP47_0017047 [Adiantum capillus-veneris]|uniref:Uncharacterized protein n=1 Tax=Adiantum capillus-veneris TaxID=13818 RepID=A0A9D4UJ71_ADICA|nr:hypothetical protein GOP47_0017047 [Adiantum capillus-veneris]